LLGFKQPDHYLWFACKEQQAGRDEADAQVGHGVACRSRRRETAGTPVPRFAAPLRQDSCRLPRPSD
jgi:hypothetical protein